MLVNKCIFGVISLIWFVLILLSRGQDAEGLIHAKLGYSKLLDPELRFEPSPIESSAVLGGHVINLATIVKKDGIEVQDSDVVLYGVDKNLIYMKCGQEVMKRINDLYRIPNSSKFAYRLRLDVASSLKEKHELTETLIDIIVISGIPVEVHSSDRSPLKVLYTEGVGDDDVTQHEIKIYGLTSLLMEKLPTVEICKVEPAKAQMVRELGKLPASGDGKRILRIQLDRLELDDRIEILIEHSQSLREQMIEVIRSELNKVDIKPPANE